MSGIFHIGYHKTGSTFLQKYFFPRSNAKAYVSGEMVNRITEPYVGDFDAQEFRSQVLDQYGENFLLSSENLIGDPLSGACNGMTIQQHAARIHEAFPDSSVVLFVREQVQMIQSIYAQYVKYGGTYPLGRLLDECRNVAPFFCYEYYEYDRTIEILKKSFAPNKVFVYDFREMRNDLPAFLHRLNDELDLQVTDFSNLDRQANVSMRKNTCRLVRALNLFTSKHMKIKNQWIDIPYADRVIGRVRVAADRWMPLNPKIQDDDFWPRGKREEVAQRYRSSNERLRDQYGIDLIEQVR